jgi:hypothetical protein
VQRPLALKRFDLLGQLQLAHLELLLLLQAEMKQQRDIAISATHSAASSLNFFACHAPDERFSTEGSKRACSISTTVVTAA